MDSVEAKCKAVFDALEKDGNLPEFIILDRLGMKGWLNEYIESEEYASEVLDTLKITGQYPERMIQESLTQALMIIEEAHKRKIRVKSYWRRIKAITKGLALLGVISSGSGFTSYVLSVAGTFGMWGMIDRVTAHSEDLDIIKGCWAATTLQQNLIPQLTNIDPANVVKTVLQIEEPKPKQLLTADVWLMHFQRWRDKGIALINFDTTLNQPSWQKPTYLTVDGAETAATDAIIQSIFAIAEEASPQVTDQEQIRNIRKEICVSVIEGKASYQ